MIGKGLIKKLVATCAAAAAAFVAVIALGATVFYALALVVVPLAAAALTASIFAAVAGGVTAVFLSKGEGHDDDEDHHEPEGLGGKAVHLFRQRPVIGTVVALVGGWIFLRNPALATMVAAAVSEKSRRRRF